MLASAPAPVAATGTPAYAARQPLYASPATPSAPMGMGMGVGMHPTSAAYGAQGQGRPLSFAQPTLSPTSPIVPSGAGAGAKKPAGAGAGNFDDLWTMGMSLGSGSKPGTPVGGKRVSMGMGMGMGMGAGAAASAKSMKDLEREKAQAGIWGVGAQKVSQAQQQQQQQQAGAGAFGSFGPVGGSAAGGADDLLL